VLRYEIKDITPPSAVRAAMEMQAEAERRKRAEILQSEGHREAAANEAEGQRRSKVLAAEGDAVAIVARAKAAAQAVSLLAAAIRAPGGADAVRIRLAEQYVQALGNLAKRGNTVVLPANVGDPSAMVATAMGVWKGLSAGGGSAGGDAAAGSSDASSDSGADASVTLRDTEPSAVATDVAGGSSSSGFVPTPLGAVGDAAADAAAAAGAGAAFAPGDAFQPTPLPPAPSSAGAAGSGFVPKPF
jgi:hypothetical protein